MFDTSRNINAFSTLGAFLSQFGEKDRKNNSLRSLNDRFYDEMEAVINRSFQHNGWFTEDNVRYALATWGEALRKEQIEKWLLPYAERLNAIEKRKSVTVIMAGNIPMVGFHDFICVLFCGYHLNAKLSSDDKFFIPFIHTVLAEIEPSFSDKVSFIDKPLDNVEAIIATGSNNSARYFEYYFGKHPHVIRKNRNGIAVLTGDEQEDELNLLGQDIFRYFGMGCRNVSKLYVPKGYSFDAFFKNIFSYCDQVINHNKYGNNYDYYRAIYLMNKDNITENGFLMLKEDNSLGSPVAVLYYEYYQDEEQLRERLKMDAGNIQCIVSNSDVVENVIPIGSSQQPQLWDYADGVDIMDFILS